MTHLLICANLGPGEHFADLRVCASCVHVHVCVRKTQRGRKRKRRVFIRAEISEGRVLM